MVFVALRTCLVFLVRGEAGRFHCEDCCSAAWSLYRIRRPSLVTGDHLECVGADLRKLRRDAPPDRL